MSAIRSQNKTQALASLPVVLSPLSAAIIQDDYRQDLNNARLAYLAIIVHVAKKRRSLLAKLDPIAQKLLHSIAKDYRLGVAHARPHCTKETLETALQLYTSF